MWQRIILLSLIVVFGLSSLAVAQQLDGNPYTPGKDANIDLYISSWKESMPMVTHGALIERPILTRGAAINPPAKGAVLLYTNRFSHATLDAGSSTPPTTLKGEQEVLYIFGGEGTIISGKKAYNLYRGIAVLIPANLAFTLKNTGDNSLTMYLISEPTPEGFRPNSEILVRDENTLPIVSTNGHWCHIVKQLFMTADGLGTLQSIITVALDPMTIAQPHSHVAGCEEVWTEITGTSILFIGKQIRMQPPGTGFLVPPDGNTPHANINTSDEQVKFFYFARYGDHEVRK